MTSPSAAALAAAATIALSKDEGRILGISWIDNTQDTALLTTQSRVRLISLQPHLGVQTIWAAPLSSQFTLAAVGANEHVFVAVKGSILRLPMSLDSGILNSSTCTSHALPSTHAHFSPQSLCASEDSLLLVFPDSSARLIDADTMDVVAEVKAAAKSRLQLVGAVPWPDGSAVLLMYPGGSVRLLQADGGSLLLHPEQTLSCSAPDPGEPRLQFSALRVVAHPSSASPTRNELVFTAADAQGRMSSWGVTRHSGELSLLSSSLGMASPPPPGLLCALSSCIVFQDAKHVVHAWDVVFRVELWQRPPGSADGIRSAGASPSAKWLLLADDKHVWAWALDMGDARPSLARALLKSRTEPRRDAVCTLALDEPDQAPEWEAALAKAESGARQLAGCKSEKELVKSVRAFLRDVPNPSSTFTLAALDQAVARKWFDVLGVLLDSRCLPSLRGTDAVLLVELLRGGRVDLACLLCEHASELSCAHVVQALRHVLLCASGAAKSAQDVRSLGAAFQGDARRGAAAFIASALTKARLVDADLLSELGRLSPAEAGALLAVLYRLAADAQDVEHMERALGACCNVLDAQSHAVLGRDGQSLSMVAGKLCEFVADELEVCQVALELEPVVDEMFQAKKSRQTGADFVVEKFSL
jgi:hypothetical protein